MPYCQCYNKFYINIGCRISNLLCSIASLSIDQEMIFLLWIMLMLNGVALCWWVPLTFCAYRHLVNQEKKDIHFFPVFAYVATSFSMKYCVVSPKCLLVLQRWCIFYRKLFLKVLIQLLIIILYFWRVNAAVFLIYPKGMHLVCVW